MWIFSWIKLPWRSYPMWEKLGWLNWFWIFHCECLYSFKLKGFCYSYSWFCSSCAVPHPDVFWHPLNGMGTQKTAPEKVLVTLFPYIFHVETKWNIVYKYLKIKIFLKWHKDPSNIHWTLNIFGLWATTIGWSKNN